MLVTMTDGDWTLAVRLAGRKTEAAAFTKEEKQ